MARHTLQHRISIKALVVSAALGLSGCGGVEFESKLLDSVGVTGLIGDGKHKEQKLETRSALVVPPSVDALPVPGSAASSEVATRGASFPQNPETIEAAQKRAAEAKRKEECDPSKGKYGSRQSGQHSDQETPSAHKKADCGSVLKDYLGDAL